MTIDTVDSMAGIKGLDPQFQAQSGEKPELHEAFTDFVGQTFFGQLLKQMRASVGKPAFVHGGFGEDVFQGQLDQVLVDGERGVGVLEVEARDDLAMRLVVGVADFLQVDFRDDVERESVLGHGAPESSAPMLSSVPLGRVPERPKGAVCKIAGVAYRGSNPLPPTN